MATEHLNGPRGRAFIPGRQSNHGGFCLPPEVSWLGEEVTFWLAVAHWCMCLGREVCRDDIALAFRVEPRKASDVMSYLHNSCPQVRTEKVVRREGPGRRVCRMRVVDIYIRERDTQSARTRPAPEGKADGSLESLKKRFLGRGGG